jgi:hypothetical protein
MLAKEPEKQVPPIVPKIGWAIIGVSAFLCQSRETNPYAIIINPKAAAYFVVSFDVCFV